MLPFGELLLGASNAKKWDDYGKKKFFINNSVEDLIPFKEEHEVLLKLYVPLRVGGGVSMGRVEMGKWGNLQKENFL